MLALLLVLAAATGCARQKRGSARALPTGDGIWFEDGVGDAENLEETLMRAGLGTVFLPGAQMSREGNHWEARQMPPPARPFVREKVFLVLAGDAGIEDALARREAVPALQDALWLAIRTLLRDTRPYGAVSGVHLDLPFSARSAEGYGSLLSGLRTKMPRGMLISASLRFSPTPEDREKLLPVISACDGFIAFVFGDGNGAEPLAVDVLEQQWWAGYAASARGARQDASGEARPVPEWVLGRLSDDPRVDFLQNVTLKEESGQSFELRLKASLSLGPEFSFRTGDRLSFRQPLVSDLIYHLGSDLAGRRFARGRIIALPGRSEAERLFTLTALSEILLGKPARPDLHVSTELGRGFVAVSAENLSPHASVFSRTSNWVEVRIPSGGIRDVQTGGFDRFEVYGSDHEPITLALATVVRFYEILIQPLEKIETARILLRRPAPRECCQTRFHVLAAAGQEVLSDAPTASAPPTQ